MATVKQAVKAIAKAAKWSETDLGHRARWLIEAGLLPKGKGGYGGAGAAEVKVKDLVTLILSMAVPVAKEAPAHIKRFRNLKCGEVDGSIWRLEDAIIDRIQFWGDGARLVASDTSVLRLSLIFDDRDPEAEIIYHQKGDVGVERSLNFSGKISKRELSRRDLVGCKKAVLFDGRIFDFLWNKVIEKKDVPKRKPGRRKAVLK